MLHAGEDTRHSRPQRVTHLRCHKNKNRKHPYISTDILLSSKVSFHPFSNVPSLTFREVFGETGLLAVSEGENRNHHSLFDFLQVTICPQNICADVVKRFASCSTRIIHLILTTFLKNALIECKTDKEEESREDQWDPIQPSHEPHANSSQTALPRQPSRAGTNDPNKCSVSPL